MPAVTIPDSAILTLANVVALIVPLFIIAMLVDSSKNAKRIGPTDNSEPFDRASVRQSRRTLLAIAVGVVVEFISFSAILSVPNSDAVRAAAINYAWLIFTGIGFLIIFYIMFIPHIELHVSTVRKDRGTQNWTIIVGWLGDLGLLAAACTARFIGATAFDHAVGLFFGVVWLLFTGFMLGYTILRKRPERVEQSNISNSQPN